MIFLGFVLSCGDFICNNCVAEPLESCPACGLHGVRQVSLASHRDIPQEVMSMMADPSSHLEALFNVLKFQVQHYKDMLSRASKRLHASKR